MNNLENKMRRQLIIDINKSKIEEATLIYEECLKTDKLIEMYGYSELTFKKDKVIIRSGLVNLVNFLKNDEKYIDKFSHDASCVSKSTTHSKCLRYEDNIINDGTLRLIKNDIDARSGFSAGLSLLKSAILVVTSKQWAEISNQ